MRTRDGADPTDSIRGWLTDPADDTGIYLADEAGGWLFRPYRDIAAHALAIAEQMVARGVRGGDGVCVVMPTDFSCAAAFYAVWACGGVFTPITPPTFGDLDEYIDHVAAILEQARPAVVITSAGLAGIVATAQDRAGKSDAGEPLVVDDVPTVSEGPVALGDPGACALLQFTSGSTGRPRGVQISWQNLATNTTMISDLLRWRPGEAMASWLPLYHDMGLVGGFLTTVTNQEDLYLMRPDQFVRDPARWLHAMTVARHTPSPSFALGYLAHRVGPDDIAGLDLRGWRTLAVGSEPVETSDLAAFTALVEPLGFDIDAFTLAYGLAESTLMVSSSERNRPITLIRPATSTLRFGRPVSVERTVDFDGTEPGGTGWIAGLGRSIPDSTVGVVDDDGQPLPDGVLGEVTVTGGSVALGYTDDREPQPGSTRLADGVLYTGDAGFLLDGEIFVLGRMGSSLKVRGRSVFAEDIESRVSAECGLTKGKLAAVAVTDASAPGVALFAEVPPGEWIAKARTIIRAQLGPAHGITVITGPRGLIRRTSSGKPRRRHMWRLFGDGALTGAVTHEADGSSRMSRPEPALAEERLTALLDAALASVTIPDDCAVVFEDRSPKASATRAPTSTSW
ncbi:hypothetical protein GCM10009624_09500 [Gordonia sinesedis]